MGKTRRTAQQTSAATSLQETSLDLQSNENPIIGVILGYYWDNGKENGNYYIIIGYILGLNWENGVILGKLMAQNSR